MTYVVGCSTHTINLKVKEREMTQKEKTKKKNDGMPDWDKMLHSPEMMALVITHNRLEERVSRAEKNIMILAFAIACGALGMAFHLIWGIK